MNEQQWLASVDPAAMLAWLRLESGNGGREIMVDRPSDRKLRLFACACCRQAWDGAVCEFCNGRGNFQTSNSYAQCPRCKNADGIGSGRIGGLTDPTSRRAVEVAERYADGLATEAEIEEARRDAFFAQGMEPTDFRAVAWQACRTHNPIEWEPVLRRTGPPAVQASLLRDIFNPFRKGVMRHDREERSLSGQRNLLQPTGIRPNHLSVQVVAAGETPAPAVQSWLAWGDGCVPKLAQAIYDERDFGRMPLLADALEEAGCEDAAILGHCRGQQLCGVCLGKGTVVVQCDPDQHPWRTDVEMCEACGDGKVPGCGWVDAGPHVRGCWVIDLLSGKE